LRIHADQEKNRSKSESRCKKEKKPYREGGETKPFTAAVCPEDSTCASKKASKGKKERVLERTHGRERQSTLQTSRQQNVARRAGGEPASPRGMISLNASHHKKIFPEKKKNHSHRKNASEGGGKKKGIDARLPGREKSISKYREKKRPASYAKNFFQKLLRERGGYGDGRGDFALAEDSREGTILWKGRPPYKSAPPRCSGKGIDTVRHFAPNGQGKRGVT